MANEKKVVPASYAKFGKTLLGGFNVDYPCPRCKQPLTTKNEAVLNGDNCPHCSASFIFDDTIRQAFAAWASERRAVEEKRQALEAEKEAAREAKRQEKARLEAEAAERRASEEESQRLAYQQRLRESLQAAEHTQRNSARDVSGALGLLEAILFLGGAGVAVLALTSVLMWANQTSESAGTLAGNLFVTAVGATVSLALTYVLFRLLSAIHAMLVLILERLESDSDRN